MQKSISFTDWLSLTEMQFFFATLALVEFDFKN